MEHPANLLTAVSDRALEDEARALFETRRVNIARREPMVSERMLFTGAERKFCLAEAASRRRVAAVLDAETARQDGRFASATPEQAAVRIEAIDREIALLPYRPLSVDIGTRERELRAERQALADILAASPSLIANAKQKAA